jgi:hypothetical protein
VTWLRRTLSRIGWLRDRRATVTRTPIFVGATLELDVVTLTGTARDLSTGGVFFATSAPLAPGLRGHLSRTGGGDPIPVTVCWRRGEDDEPGKPAGLGLAFE